MWHAYRAIYDIMEIIKIARKCKHMDSSDKLYTVPTKEPTS
jgi:hypothetical protein